MRQCQLPVTGRAATCERARWLGSAWAVAVLAAVVAALLAHVQTPVVWKLAQRTLFYADIAGLRELASTQGLPGGVLDWLARGLQVTGLGACGWSAYAVVAAITVALWRFAFPARFGGLWSALTLPPALLAVYPACLVGATVWSVECPSAGFCNALGLWMALGVFVLARRTKAWIAAPVAAALFPWFGCYPLFGALAASVWCLPLAVVPWGAAAFIYHDLAPSAAYRGCEALFGGSGTLALDVANAFAFSCFLLAAWLPALTAKLKSRAPWSRRDAAIPALVAAALVVAVLVAQPRPDYRGQLMRERAVVERRWEDVLSVAPRNDKPLRMESAYRILALQRLGQLPDRLFDESMPVSHLEAGTDEYLMDGYELLFAYGLLLPARHLVFERMSDISWTPRYFQVLGDIALLYGEKELAARNYRHLLRCPYYGDSARSRIASLEAKELSVPSDLEPVAKLACAANEMFSAEKLVFSGDTRNVEQFAYDVFGNMKVCDEMTVRLWLACMLLNKNYSRLAQDRAVVETLYGCSVDAAPECVRRALLAADNETNSTGRK